MKKKILKFKEENLQGLHFFTIGISFPVAVAAYSEVEMEKIEYLDKRFRGGDIHTTFDLCVWCINQNIAYQIVFPFEIKTLVSNPIRTYDYFKLQKRLRVYQEKVKK
jgi:hypothetical protein